MSRTATIRNILGAGALLTLAACGFSPIYGAHGNNAPVAAQLNQIAIASIAERQGQMLRNDLIDLMYVKGRPANPQYRLEVSLHSTEEEIGRAHV